MLQNGIDCDVIIKSGKAVLKKKWTTDESTYTWRSCRISGDHDPTFEMKFRDAYEIKDKYLNEGIHDCVYQVQGREFKDLSFKDGKTLLELDTKREVIEVIGWRKITLLEEAHEIREYPDGTKFLFFYEDVPTFDSYDREWDGDKYVVVYRGREGFNLIHCRCGYMIGHIDIYLGLKDVPPEISKWLELLDAQNIEKASAVLGSDLV